MTIDLKGLKRWNTTRGEIQDNKDDLEKAFDEGIISEDGGDTSLEKEIDEYARRITVTSNLVGLLVGLVIGIACIGVVVGVSASYIVLLRDQGIESRKAEVTSMSLTIYSKLSEKIRLMFGSLEVMTEFAIQNNYTIKNDAFIDMASRLAWFYPLVSNFEYASGPNMSITHVAPYSPLNNVIIGLPLMNIDMKHKAQILRAIATNQTTMYGPVSLIEGGIAIIAQLPILYPNYSVYGISVCLVSLDVLLANIGFYDILANYDYDLYVYNGDKIFARKGTNNTLTNTLNMKGVTAPKGSISINMTILDEVWRFDIVPLEGWYNDNYIWLETIVIFVICMLCMIVSIFIARQLIMSILGRKNSQFIKDKLECQVRDRTKEQIDQTSRLVTQLQALEGKTKEFAAFANTWGLSIIGIQFVDNIAIITEINDTFAKVTGITTDICIGRPLSDYFINPPNLITLYEKHGSNLITTKLRVRLNDGTEVKIMSSISFKNDSGFLKGTIAMREMSPTSSTETNSTGSSSLVDDRNIQNLIKTACQNNGKAYIVKFMDDIAEYRKLTTKPERMVKFSDIVTTHANLHPDLLTLQTDDYEPEIFDQIYQSVLLTATQEMAPPESLSVTTP